MIEAIFIIGKPGSGKTDLAQHFTSFLVAAGFEVSYISDRIGLEEAVLLDTQFGFEDDEGVRYGLHSKLIANGLPGQRKVHVLDGALLNQVHEDMVASVALERPRGTVVLAEYAIGPNIDFGAGKEPLWQSAHHLVERSQRFGVIDRLLIVDVEASLPVRSAREARRPDAMAPETFRAYFPDGGEMSAELVATLGDRYWRFDNGGDNLGAFYAEARQFFEVQILPRIGSEGDWRDFEGGIRKEGLDY